MEALSKKELIKDVKQHADALRALGIYGHTKKINNELSARFVRTFAFGTPFEYAGRKIPFTTTNCE